jgi:phosphoribosylformylglycinamidine cyclo-ligase
MLRRLGSVPEPDWRRTFNLGVGMIFAVPAKRADKALRTLARAGEKGWVIGEVVTQRRNKGRVEYH